MLKTYKFRMYPNSKQNEIMWNHVHACRFVYNWALETKIKAYENDKSKLSCFDLNKKLVDLKKIKPWLKEVNAQSLQGSIRILDNSFTRFFRDKSGFPNFKSRKNSVKSFKVPQSYKVMFKQHRVFLPKIGYVKTIFSREFNGDLKTATVSITKTNKWFINILVDDNEKPNSPSKIENESTIGIDMGIKSFATLSNGEKIDNPKHLKKSIERIRVLDRRLSKKVNGSHNKTKASLKISKKYEKIKNQRNDFINKVSTRIVSENQTIAIETLDIINMVSSKKSSKYLSRSIYDASWRMFFFMLEYKCKQNGKNLLKIGRFTPSSKICNCCGYINSNLSLSDRNWKCPSCGTLHDRDVNAAINIKKFALQDQNLIGINSGLGQSGGPVDLPYYRKDEPGNL